MVQDLASLLMEWLDKGRVAGEDVLRLAGQVLGSDSPDAVAEVLSDVHSPEHQMFRELMLFPDAALERAVCSVLQWQSLEEGGDDISFEVVRLVPVLRCRVGDEWVDVALKVEDIQQVLSRLHVFSCFPHDLWRLLAAMPESVCLDAGMRLRRSRVCWNGSTTHFAGAVIRRLGESGAFPELLDYTCRFLEFVPNEVALLDALRLRREEVKRHLKYYSLAMKQLQQGNYETMIMTGQLPPHADPVALEHEMDCIDAICPAVFGVPAHSTVVESDLGSLAGADGVELLMRLGGDGGFQDDW